MQSRFQDYNPSLPSVRLLAQHAATHLDIIVDIFLAVNQPERLVPPVPGTSQGLKAQY